MILDYIDQWNVPVFRLLIIFIVLPVQGNRLRSSFCLCKAMLCCVVFVLCCVVFVLCSVLCFETSKFETPKSETPE